MLKNKCDICLHVFYSDEFHYLNLTTFFKFMHCNDTKVFLTDFYNIYIYISQWLIVYIFQYSIFVSVIFRQCVKNGIKPPLLGRGDNLQLFISPLLKYEEWLYNIIDDKNFKINSLEPPCTGGLKIPHTPMGTCRNAKNYNFEFCFDCGKNVFQWTKKNHLGHFD